MLQLRMGESVNFSRLCAWTCRRLVCCVCAVCDRVRVGVVTPVSFECCVGRPRALARRRGSVPMPGRPGTRFSLVRRAGPGRAFVGRASVSTQPRRVCRRGRRTLMSSGCGRASRPGLSTGWWRPRSTGRGGVLAGWRRARLRPMQGRAPRVAFVPLCGRRPPFRRAGVLGRPVTIVRASGDDARPWLPLPPKTWSYTRVGRVRPLWTSFWGRGPSAKRGSPGMRIRTASVGRGHASDHCLWCCMLPCSVASGPCDALSPPVAQVGLCYHRAIAASGLLGDVFYLRRVPARLPFSPACAPVCSWGARAAVCTSECLVFLGARCARCCCASVWFVDGTRHVPRSAFVYAVWLRGCRGHHWVALTPSASSAPSLYIDDGCAHTVASLPFSRGPCRRGSRAPILPLCCVLPSSRVPAFLCSRSRAPALPCFRAASLAPVLPRARVRRAPFRTLVLPFSLPCPCAPALGPVLPCPLSSVLPCFLSPCSCAPVLLPTLASVFSRVGVSVVVCCWTATACPLLTVRFGRSVGYGPPSGGARLAFHGDPGAGCAVRAAVRAACGWSGVCGG